MTTDEPEFRKRLKPTSIHRNEAFRKLQTDLEAVSELYRRGDEYKRPGVNAAQIAIVDFLRACGFHETRIDPFVRVIGALTDADRGVPDPVFEVTKNTGRVKRSWRQMGKESILAAIAELYWRSEKMSGERLHIVMRRAASEISRRKKFGDITGPELKGIRDRVMTAEPTSLERKNYEVLISGPLATERPLDASRAYMDLADNPE